MILGVALVLLTAIIAALLIGGGSKPASAGEVLLQPVNSAGPFPWTGSVVGAGAPTSVPLPTTPPTPPTTHTGAAVLSAVTGDRVGIYGGTLQLSVCDKTKLTRFLESNPAQAAAWAGVEGISPSDIPSYIDSLTAVILGADTRVTNHGFSNGHATTLQSVLQAGTAVLIDKYGVPRTRCYCGNPLLQPVLSSAPTYTGSSWPGFDPGRVIVVQPASAPMKQVSVVDTGGGGALAIPVGANPAPGQIASPPATAAPTPATVGPPLSTEAPLPTVTVAPPSLPPQTLPPPTGPPPTAAGPSYQLVGIRVTRTYGGNAAPDKTGTPCGPSVVTGSCSNAGFPVSPGTVTVGPSQTQFQFGWDFQWGDKLQNRDRGVATVVLTQVSTRVQSGTAAPFAASISGDWNTSGYGNDRDHTIALAGAAGDQSKDVVDNASSTASGSTSTSGSTAPAIGSGQAVETITCKLTFGSDQTGQMVIELLYNQV